MEAVTVAYVGVITNIVEHAEEAFKNTMAMGATKMTT